MIYLDNAATTQPCDAAVEAAREAAQRYWCNPSSLYKPGLEVQLQCDAARKTVAQALGAQEKNIFFTSGGTEANNLAIHSALTTGRRRGAHVVSSAYEHASIHEKLRSLPDAEVTFVPAEKETGEVDPKKIAAAVRKDTVLVTVMMSNNEVGGINNIAEIVRLVKEKNPQTLVHCDCVAAFGKLPISAKKLGVDTLTVSAHKIHGLKGTGALYVRDKLHTVGLLVGGEQERELRPGTENVPGILAMAAAVKETVFRQKENAAYVRTLKEHLLERVNASEFVTVNCHNDFPYVVSLYVKGLRSEILLHFLESKDIYVSSGSACSKGAKTHVLASMGFDPQVQDSTVRVSFCEKNTLEEVDRLIDEIENAERTLCTGR